MTETTTLDLSFLDAEGYTVTFKLENPRALAQLTEEAIRSRATAAITAGNGKWVSSRGAAITTFKSATYTIIQKQSIVDDDAVESVGA